MAAAERWLARVWPAIALGGNAAGISSSPISVVQGDLLRPAVAAVAQLLALVPAISQAAGDPSLSTPAARANDPKPTVFDASSPTDWMKIVYLVTLIALLAVLAFTIWKEMGPVLRAGLR